MRGQITCYAYNIWGENVFLLNWRQALTGQEANKGRLVLNQVSKIVDSLPLGLQKCSDMCWWRMPLVFGLYFGGAQNVTALLAY